ncbi:MAG: DUF3848 domain-containing protein [Ruminococcaceae bacterium]|nr:DUF3848 domain-containing protein [Oscillospiraceae bacterium]
MNLKSRDESLETLSKTLKSEQLRAVITQPYTDTALSVMSEIPAIADTRFSAAAVNKLSEAYANEKISGDDLEHISRFAPRDNRNEPYIDEFLNSIDKGVYHTTAAKIFAAVGYENHSYNEALDFVKSGAFYPTDHAGLSVTEDVSRELDKMCYPLRACEGFNYCYDIDSAERLEGALERSAAITVSDKMIAVKVNEAMKREDWHDLREYITSEMGQYIGDLSGQIFDEICADFECVKLSDVLYDKVRAEYDKFISDMQKGTTAAAIESAYEIVWKDNITQYLENENPNLTKNQYAALISSKNALDEIYEEWCSNGELHSYDDVEIAIGDTAKKREYSLEQEQRMREQPPVIPEVKAEDIPAPTEPKRRSR